MKTRYQGKHMRKYWDGEGGLPADTPIEAQDDARHDSSMCSAVGRKNQKKTKHIIVNRIIVIQFSKKHHSYTCTVFSMLVCPLELLRFKYVNSYIYM